MSLESITVVADQQTQTLLAFSGALAQSRMSFTEAASNQQIADLLINPSNPTELLAHMNSAAAVTRGSQGPILPDAR